MITSIKKNVVEITKPKHTLAPEFDSLQWVLKARSTDDWKPVFTKVYIDEENIVCTDARRLHIIKKYNELLQTIQPGLYDVIKIKSREIVLCESNCNDKFPNYKLIIPTVEFAEILSTPNGFTSGNISRLFRNFYKLSEKSAIGMDLTFLKEAFMPYEYTTVNVKIENRSYDNTSPIVIKDKTSNHLAVIMPIQVKTEDV